MKILIYEHVSGGGFTQQPIPPDALAEGFGMLRTIVSDFKAAGHDVTVLLDYRISKLNVPIAADCTVPIFSKGETEKFLAIIAKVNEAVFIIAPETGRTLESLVRQVERTGAVSLNCSSSVIQKVADKASLYEILKEKGMPIPKTVLLNINDDLANIKQTLRNEFRYPLILKPTDGVSCSGLSNLKEEAEILKGIEKIKNVSSNSCFIAQELISGEAASVSLLSTGKKTLALSLNKQNVTLANPDSDSSYDGGLVPFEHPLRSEAFVLAEKVVDCFPGLKGYVGVDMVLTKSKPFVVDVNPRLTTSYVALSKVANFNFSQAILNAVLKNELPNKTESSEFSVFSKIETPAPSMEAFQNSLEIIEVVCPPFPIGDNGNSVGIVAGYGDTLEDAGAKLEEAKNRLCGIISRGK